MTPDQKVAVERVRDYLECALPTRESVAPGGSDNGIFVASIDIQRAFEAGGSLVTLPSGLRQIIPSDKTAKHYADLAQYDRAVWTACMAFCSAFLMSGDGGFLPRPFQEFAAKVMRGNCPCPEPQGGDSYGNLARDICIAHAVYALREAGIPVIGSGSKHEGGKASACQIISELKSVPLSESAVYKRWKILEPFVTDINQNGYDCISKSGKVPYMPG